MFSSKLIKLGLFFGAFLLTLGFGVISSSDVNAAARIDCTLLDRASVESTPGGNTARVRVECRNLNNLGPVVDLPSITVNYSKLTSTDGQSKSLKASFGILPYKTRVISFGYFKVAPFPSNIPESDSKEKFTIHISGYDDDSQLHSDTVTFFMTHKASSTTTTSGSTASTSTSSSSGGLTGTSTATSGSSTTTSPSGSTGATPTKPDIAGKCIIVAALDRVPKGERIQTTYKITNTGKKEWTKTSNGAVNWYLGLGSPRDDTSFGHGFVRPPIPGTLKPGQSVNISVVGVATKEATVQHQLLKEGTAWYDSVKCPEQSVKFGLGSVAGECTVKVPIIPARTGQNISTTYTVKNTGTRTWENVSDASKAWYLGMGIPHHDSTVLKGNFARAKFTKQVKPGQSIEVKVYGKAAELNPNYVKHRLLKEGEKWFDSVVCPQQKVVTDVPEITPGPPRTGADSYQKIKVNPCGDNAKFGTHTFHFNISSLNTGSSKQAYIRYKPRDANSKPKFSLDAYNYIQVEDVNNKTKENCYKTPSVTLGGEDGEGWHYALIIIPFKSSSDNLDIFVDKSTVAELDFIYLPTKACSLKKIDKAFNCLVKPTPTPVPSRNYRKGPFYFEVGGPDHWRNDEGANKGSFYLFNFLPVMLLSPGTIGLNSFSATPGDVGATLFLAGVIIVLIGSMLYMRKRMKIKKGVYAVMIFAVVATVSMLIVSAGSSGAYQFDKNTSSRGDVQIKTDSTASSNNKIILR